MANGFDIRIICCGDESLTNKGLHVAAALIFILIFTFAILVVGLTFAILFLLTLYRTMQKVRPGLRQISPATVWFCMIPIFGGFFAIWMVQAVATSLRKQFEEFEEDDRASSYGQTAGMLWTLPMLGIYVVAVAGIALDFNDFASLINNLLALVSFISWIVYWVQISNFGKKLKSLKRTDYSPEELDYVDDLEPDRNDR